MLKSVDGGMRTAPFVINDPERIPSQRYYDASFYQAEVDHLWPHVWQMACRLEQIPEVGDWVEYQNLGKSVVVVRTEGGIKAFHNSCRHRGVPVAGGKGNGHGNCKSSGFVCPFHGWRYNMDGENTFVYGRQLFNERQLDQAALNLMPCRAEVAIGSVFINFDDEAPSFRDSMGPLIDRLDAHHVDRLRVEWWYGTVLPANWKLAMEAFMEGYHVMKTHPQLQQVIPMMFDGMYCGTGKGSAMTTDRGLTMRENIYAHFAQLETTSIGMAGLIHAKEVEIARAMIDIDLPEDHDEALLVWYGKVQDEITRQLREQGEPVPDLNAIALSARLEGVEFLFPHYFLLPSFTSFASYRVRPLGPESCLFELWSLTMFPEGQEPETPMQPTMLPYDSPQFPPIPRQDYSNIPIQQLGVHAKGFEFMRLAKDVEGLVSNYQRLIDGYLAGVPVEKLAKANHLLGGNFDGPIHELGF